MNNQILNQLFKDNPNRNCDWEKLSHNPNITWDIIKDNPDKPWSWLSISCNPNITPEIIKEKEPTPTALDVLGEKGCTEPIYGEKSKCVLKIVPQSKKVDTFQIDEKCIKRLTPIKDK